MIPEKLPDSSSEETFGVLDTFSSNRLQETDFRFRTNIPSYSEALKAASRVLTHRGFHIDTSDNIFSEEKEKIRLYIQQAIDYILDSYLAILDANLPYIRQHVPQSPNMPFYNDFFEKLRLITETLKDPSFLQFLHDDPRHLLLLAASNRHPNVFQGCDQFPFAPSDHLQQVACGLLKTVKQLYALYCDSDIAPFLHLSLFLQQKHFHLKGFHVYDWSHPSFLPASHLGQEAYARVAAFISRFSTLYEYDLKSQSFIARDRSDIRNGEDDILLQEPKTRIKSPQSMLLKSLIREPGAWDFLGVAFVLKDKTDVLKFLSLLEKAGLINEEIVVKNSLRQTLFRSCSELVTAMKKLFPHLSDQQVNDKSIEWWERFQSQSKKNHVSHPGHQTLHFKIAYPVFLYYDDRNNIVIPGSKQFRQLFEERTSSSPRDNTFYQYPSSLPVEIRISTEQAFEDSELNGAQSHEVYDTRRALRYFSEVFNSIFPRLTDEILQQFDRDCDAVFGPNPLEDLP